MTLKNKFRRNSMNFFKNPFSDSIGIARAGCGEICDAYCESTGGSQTGSNSGAEASSGKSL